MATIHTTTDARLDAAAKQQALWRRRRRELLRHGILLAILYAVGMAFYHRLLPVQAFMRPNVPPGGWVIDPNRAYAPGVAFWAPLVLSLSSLARLRLRWDGADDRRGDGSRNTLSHRWIERLSRTRVEIFLWVVVLVGCGFALGDFQVVSASQMRRGLLTHQYTDVQEVVFVPAGYRGDGRKRIGPCAVVIMKNSSYKLEFGETNGLTEPQSREIAEFIAARAGKQVLRFADQQPR